MPNFPQVFSYCFIISYAIVCTTSNFPKERRSIYQGSQSFKPGWNDPVVEEALTPDDPSEPEGRENEKQQGIFPKLFGYLRNAFTSSGDAPEASDKVEAENAKETNLAAYEDEDLGLDLEDHFEEELEDDAGESDIKGETGRDFEGPVGNGTLDERRGMPIYLFQGQYLAEPRLNRFVDGAMENLGQEMKTATMDPLFFKVLPKGRVLARPKPIRRFPGKPNRRRRRRPVNRVQRFQSVRPFAGRNLEGNSTDWTSEFIGLKSIGRQMQRRRAAANRNRRTGRNRVVGAGRIEGLSKVLRDGDAEMQLFGNYTLIRAHYNMGPLHLVMQFRTIRGIRRADATIEKVKMHTVTRVNTQGCEMIDFLLDRPHPETIEIRGQLFPLASRVARNVFSRLFATDSFLVTRLREKTGLALLSRKTSF